MKIVFKPNQIHVILRMFEINNILKIMNTTNDIYSDIIK